MTQKAPLPVGYRSGKLTVVSFSHRSKTGSSLYRCICDCGTEVIRQRGHLTNPNRRNQSCGCSVHRTHGKSETPEFKAYNAAYQRCTNQNLRCYKNYGGRGIEFRFSSFEQWWAELGPRPSAKHSIDRIDNDGHYEPGNVRWATGSEQIRNQRPRKKKGG